MKIPAQFPTLSEMLTPQTLTYLTGSQVPVESFTKEILETGFSGNLIERLTLKQNGQEIGTLILKQNETQTSWFAKSTHDDLGREVRFAQSELWEHLPDSIDSPILATVLWPDNASAILMRDEGAAIFSAAKCYETAENDAALLPFIVNALADMHAAFWNSPMLEQVPWLTSPADSLLYLTLPHLTAAGTDGESIEYGGAAMRMWGRIWSMLNPATAQVIQQTIAHPQKLLAAIESLPQTLIHGDIWLANLGVRDTKLLILDWALVAKGPALYDPMWLAQTWRAADPQETSEMYRAALLQRGVTDAQNDTIWALMMDCAVVRSLFTSAEWLAREVVGASTDEDERVALAHIRYWMSRAAEIITARGW